jgi:peptidyl-dipeptidase Dcp
LLQEYQGPYGGVPVFDKMELKGPETCNGTRDGPAPRRDRSRLPKIPEPPTFKNTIEALERAGKPLNRVFTYYGIWSSNVSSPEFREIQGELAPMISDYSSKDLTEYRSYLNASRPFMTRLKKSL